MFESITVPQRGDPNFNAQAEAFALAMAKFAEDYNQLSSLLNGALQSESTTSLTFDTDDKAFDMQANLSFLPGFPIRLVSKANPTTKFLDCVVKTYNKTTGATTASVNISSGSGSANDWSIFALPAGGNFASVTNNKFLGRQVFANEVTLASDTTLDFTAADTNQFIINGTASISSVTMERGAVIKAWFNSTATLIHSSTFQIPGGTDYTVEAGEVLTFTSNGSVVKVELPTKRRTGEIFIWPSNTPPAGSMQLPLFPTDGNRTTFKGLYAKFGTTFGAGDGVNTFGLPFLRQWYAILAANGNTGQETTGQVQSHDHLTILGSGAGGGNKSSTYSFDHSGQDSRPTSSTGGSINRAAGVAYTICIWL